MAREPLRRLGPAAGRWAAFGATRGTTGLTGPGTISGTTTWWLPTTRLSTPSPTASAAAAPSGGTAAVARSASDGPATGPTLPATETASTGTVAVHATG